MLNNLETKQKKIIGIVGIVIIILLGIFFYNKINTKEEVDLEEDILISNNSSKESVQEEQGIIVVHITGAVKTPGVVRLPEGSRIEDAIEQARRFNRG